MAGVIVARLSYGSPDAVGTLREDGSSFAYDAGYLHRPDTVPLSLSLPLREEPFAERDLRPYFEGLIAEGMARRALAETLQVSEDDYLAILVRCGRDCIGDVLVWREGEEPPAIPLAYEPVSREELAGVVRGLPESSAENASSRLSLAGAQSKIGLARHPEADDGGGWLRPRGLAATTHILKTSPLRDLPEIEHLCMCAARRCGIAVARTHLLALPTPVLAVERFDRDISLVGGALRVARRHQEDLAQAFSLLPGSKYVELPGGSVASVARLIRARSARPARDLAQLARVLLFCYAIGNCDAHLKNYSVELAQPRRAGDPVVSLAPAYDLVCTTRYPRFSRDLAMAYGGVRAIDEVGPDELAGLAGDLGVAVSTLRGFARDIVDVASDAIEAAGEGAFGPVLDSTPYVAEDLVEDMAPRIAVLGAFGNG